MAVPITKEEYVEYVEDYRRRHGGSAYDVVNGRVEADRNAYVEGWAIYMLANAIPREWFPDPQPTKLDLSKLGDTQ